MPRTWIFPLCVIVATVAIYVPNFRDGYLNWDYSAYQQVLNRTDYAHLAWELLIDFKGKIVTGYYAPISSLSLMLDKSILGAGVPQAWQTLLINLLLHCVNGVFVRQLLLSLGVNSRAAGLAMAVFLLHPLQVSSVMWFAQRKGVMAEAFYLAAFIVYLRARTAASFRGYAASVTLFVIAMLCKPTTIVLPLALLCTELLFPTQTFTRQPVRGYVRTVPFFAVSATFAVLAVMTEPSEYIDLPLVERPFLAAGTTWFYVSKVLVPLGLSPLYPSWHVDPTAPAWWLLLAAAVLAFATVVVLRHRIGSFMTWGIATFVIGVLPAMGLVRFGYFRLSYVADHFLYVSMVGASCCLGLLLAGMFEWLRVVVLRGAYVMVGVYLILLGFDTCMYARVWRDSYALWGRVISENPDSWAAHTFLGHAHLADGDTRQAEKQFRHSLDLRLKYENLYRKQAQDHQLRHEQYHAQRFAGRAAEVREGLAFAYYNLGNALLRANRLSEAMVVLREALIRKPDFAEAHNNLGIALLESGNKTAALEHFRQVLAIDPDNADARYNLMLALEEDRSAPQTK
ncbi:MAG: tetratricopeptide repeat protein [Thermodesulfobacteriota bacterium]